VPSPYDYHSWLMLGLYIWHVFVIHRQSDSD
jgi:hypothetical protein